MHNANAVSSTVQTRSVRINLKVFFNDFRQDKLDNFKLFCLCYMFLLEAEMKTRKIMRYQRLHSDYSLLCTIVSLCIGHRAGQKRQKGQFYLSRCQNVLHTGALTTLCPILTLLPSPAPNNITTSWINLFLYRQVLNRCFSHRGVCWMTPPYHRVCL